MPFISQMYIFYFLKRVKLDSNFMPEPNKDTRIVFTITITTTIIIIIIITVMIIIIINNNDDDDDAMELKIISLPSWPFIHPNIGSFHHGQIIQMLCFVYFGFSFIQ